MLNTFSFEALVFNVETIAVRPRQRAVSLSTRLILVGGCCSTVLLTLVIGLRANPYLKSAQVSLSRVHQNETLRSAQLWHSRLAAELPSSLRQLHSRQFQGSTLVVLPLTDFSLPARSSVRVVSFNCLTRFLLCTSEDHLQKLDSLIALHWPIAKSEQARHTHRQPLSSSSPHRQGSGLMNHHSRERLAMLFQRQNTSNDGKTLLLSSPRGQTADPPRSMKGSPHVVQQQSKYLLPEMRISLSSAFEYQTPMGSAPLLQASEATRYGLMSTSASDQQELSAGIASTRKALASFSDEYLDNVTRFNDKLKMLRRYTKAIALQPTKANLYYKRANLLIELNRFSSALSDYNQTLQLDPNFEDAVVNRGALKRQMGDLPGALADYSLAIKQNPRDSVPFRNRGIVYERLGDSASAAVDWKVAAAMGDSDARHWVQVSAASIPASSAAAKSLPATTSPVRRPGPTLPDVMNKTGISEQLGKLNAAINSYPTRFDAYFRRGNYFLATNDLTSALYDYNRALSLNPLFAKALINRGVVKRRLGDLSGALADYTAVIRLLPRDSDAYKNRGIVKEQLGNLSGACSDWGFAAALGSDDAKQWTLRQCH